MVWSQDPIDTDKSIPIDTSSKPPPRRAEPPAPAGLSPWIELHPEDSRPLHRQLYEALRTAVLSGRIHPGGRLPPTRGLASELGISRTTVVTAYRQLEAEGYVVGRQGSGTYVRSPLPEHLLHAERAEPERHPPPRRGPPPLSGRGRRLSSSTSSPESDPVRPFLPGVPALDAFPRDLWERLLQTRWRQLPEARLGYTEVGGTEQLRAAVAGYLRSRRGVRCEPGQVLVTAGTQHSLALAAELLLEPGDAVWLEDPAYPGALRAFRAAGARIVPVPVDDEGLRLQEALRAAPTARMAYVTPSHQFPTGAVLSLPRRLELLEWAAEHDAWILEDDYDSEFRYRGRPLQALQGIDLGGVVLYLGTFSKIVFPALRVGYVVVPPALVEPARAALAAGRGPPPSLVQAVLAEFLAEGHLARHLRRMRILYEERQAILVDALATETQGRIATRAGDGGMHLVADLPPAATAGEVARQAAARGVTALPLATFRHGGRDASREALVLGFAGWPRPALRRAARLLGHALDAALGTRNSAVPDGE